MRPCLTQNIPEQNFGISGTVHSLTLSTLPKHFAVIQMEGHKHIRNILEKTFNYLFFPSDFLAVGQRSTLGMNRFCDLIKTSCACSGTSFKPAAETLALWLKIPALISTWLCGHHHSHSPLLDWRLWLGYFSRMYFLLCSLLCPAVGRGNSAQETHLILLSYT